MRVFGMDVNFGSKIDKINKEIDDKYQDSKFGDMRTMLDYVKSLGGEEVRVPYYPLHERTLFDIAVYSDTLRTIHMQLKKEIFRHGYKVEERFAMKCEQCLKEFKHPVDQCDECGSRDLRDPNVEEKKRLLIFIKKCNDNNQDILDVAGQVSDDLEIVDDGYMHFIKDYYFDNKGEVKYEVPVELLRAHPMHIRIIADRAGRPGRDSEGKEVLTCIEHRHKYYSDITHCAECGRRLFPAHFRGEQYNGQYIYYVKGEIFHRSKYKQSLTYGFPPILSVWLKITTLMAQDRYINTYYTRQRPPRGLLFVNTPNMASLMKAWNWMIDKFKTNPHTIPPIAIEAPQGHRGKFVEFIDFMRSLDEMQFTETRNEFRRQIGAVYGVMPLFQADTSTSGGLNNEGLQITVTNRAIEDGQGIFNDGYFPWILEQLDIKDYILVLEPSEEKDEMAEETLRTQKINNARLMQGMGYEVTLNEDNEFEFEPTETPVEAPMGGQMGGFGGGMGGFGQGGSSGQFGASPASLNPPEAKSPGSQSRFGGEPESVGKVIDLDISKELYATVNTGKIVLGLEKRKKIQTKEVDGEVEKVIIKYLPDTSDTMNVVVATPDGEEMVNVVSNENAIYYPRNWNVQNEKYTKSTRGKIVDQAAGAMNAEKYTCLGSITIILEGTSEYDGIEDIQILIKGKVKGGKMKVQDLDNTRAEITKSDFYDKGKGDTAEAVLWKNEEVQEKRFEVMESLFKGEKSPQILDAGAGLGHFYDYLCSKGYTPYYTGFDIKEKFVDVARSKGRNVHLSNIKDISKFSSADYVLASGVFNLKDSGDWKAGVQEIYNQCNKAAAINFITKAPDAAYREFNEKELLEFGTKLGASVEVVKGYLDNDITLVLHKEDAPVTSDTPGVYNPTFGGWRGRRRRHIKEFMNRVLSETIKKEKIDMLVEKQDDDVDKMVDFIEDSIFSKKFEGVGIKDSNLIKRYMVTALQKGYPIVKITEYIVNKTSVNRVQAEMIARTEVQALQNSVREWSYKKIDPDEKFEYKWLGPADDRTSKICENIKSRTIRGVSLNKLRTIVKEESIKGGFDGSREFTPHISCRHTFVRVI